MIGEIVEATGFNEPDTYIMYKIFLPEEGWLFDDNNEYEMDNLTRDDYMEFNKRRSVTHVS